MNDETQMTKRKSVRFPCLHSDFIGYSGLVIRVSLFVILARTAYAPIMHFLAAVDFSSPMIWAILIGWILSVVLHEFAHGIIAYWGGDYTIKERGGLTLNPLQYIDPVMSIILPVVFLLMGGIPLPGGATYIRRDLIHGRAWNVAVSAAGPASNFILFLLLTIPLHPRVGWVDPNVPPGEWTTAQVFCGAMAVLQLFATLLNLLPVPPLDGFQIVAPFLKEETRTKLMTPPYSTAIFFGLFLFLMNSSAPGRVLRKALIALLEGIGYDGFSINALWRAFVFALYGSN